MGVLSIGEGFRHALRTAGSPQNALVLRSGSDSEMMSVLLGDAVEIIAQAPGIARGSVAPGEAPIPLTSAELFVVVDIPKKSTGTPANVPLRGVQPAAFAPRPDVTITSGRRFEFGKNEVIVGEGALRQFRGLDVGTRVKCGQNEWNVVGTFSADGALWESKHWTDARVLRISPVYPVVEAVTAAVFVLHYQQHGWSALFVVRLAFAAAMIALFTIDLEHQILPNLITFPGIAIGLVASLFVEPGWRSAVLGALLGGGLLWLVSEAYFRIRGVEGLGFGDVKMLAMIGAFLGWKLTIVTLFGASLAGAALGLALIAAGRGSLQLKLPFGSFLAVGAVAAGLWGQPFVDWYASFYR